MFAANTYRIRIATDEDTGTLRRLTEQSSEQPLEGRVLIGEIEGVGAAAVSLTDGRPVADSNPRIGHLIANLRVRARSIWDYEGTPSLNARLIAGLPAWYRAIAVPTSCTDSESVERDARLVTAG
jgi:hypothetical protein